MEGIVASNSRRYLDSFHRRLDQFLVGNFIQFDRTPSPFDTPVKDLRQDVMAKSLFGQAFQGGETCEPDS